MSCDTERLERMLDGELAAEEFRETELHLAGCAACRQDLDWLRAERRMVAARRQSLRPLPPSLWAGIEARLAVERPPVELPREPRRSLLWGIFGGFATLTAAAAAMVALLTPRAVQLSFSSDLPALASTETTEPAPDLDRPRRARRSILEAERQYMTAIRELEEDYQDRRRGLPPATAEQLDRQFADLRHTIVQARRDANGSPQGRRRTLDAYAAYVRSMQRVAFDQEL